jgi:alpha-L-fucosidase
MAPRGRFRWRRIRRILAWALVAIVAVAGILVGGYAVGSWAWTARDDSRAVMTTRGPYQATKASLNSHQLPAWFADAKFGIMIHWGLYSVPGYAPTGSTFSELLSRDYDHAMTRNPYAEDYANAMADPSSPTAAYHREHYGDAPYSDFARQFDAELARWDPAAWATTFRAAGASYVVVTAKYADGYSMWPTTVRNPHAPDFHARRDLLGELAKEVRRQGMRFGVYYSGGVDWTFQPTVVQTVGDYSYLPYGEDYRAYATAQVRELIDRYRPDILWNDISWPTGEKRLFALLADYYNTVPNGVINDRWRTASFGHQVMGLRPCRWAFDRIVEEYLSDPKAAERLRTPPEVPHSDFRTPEYTGFTTVQRTFWQSDRGIGGSFGYNRAETDSDHASVADLLVEMVRATANNGALLLDVGPAGGEGTIVEYQRSRLTGIGDWLRTNREGLDSTRPWARSTATASGGHTVAFSSKGSTVYAIVLGQPRRSVTISGVSLTGTATILGSDRPVSLVAADGGTVITSDGFDGGFGRVVRISVRENPGQ